MGSRGLQKWWPMWMGHQLVSLAMMGSVCKFDRRQELGSPQTVWLSSWRGARRPCFTLPTLNQAL